jgi:hypothetical protein
MDNVTKVLIESLREEIRVLKAGEKERFAAGVGLAKIAHLAVSIIYLHCMIMDKCALAPDDPENMKQIKASIKDMRSMGKHILVLDDMVKVFLPPPPTEEAK